MKLGGWWDGQVYECVELFAGRAIVSTAMKAIGIPAAALDICMADRFPAMDLTTASGMALLDQVLSLQAQVYRTLLPNTNSTCAAKAGVGDSYEWS